MLFRDSYNFDLFDACVKAGIGGSETLVSLVLNSDSPSSESKLRRLPPNAFTRRVSCSLRVGHDLQESCCRADANADTKIARLDLFPSQLEYVPYFQRTEAKSCSLSAADATGWGGDANLELNRPKSRVGSTQRTEASPCAVRTRDVNRTNGRCAIRKVQPASQQRVSPSGLTTFPPAGKSGLSPGKRFTSERLWCVIRRASQSSLNSYPIDIGYGALTEQARMTGSTPNPNKKGYGSVAGITEQGLTSVHA